MQVFRIPFWDVVKAVYDVANVKMAHLYGGTHRYYIHMHHIKYYTTTSKC